MTEKRSFKEAILANYALHEQAFLDGDASPIASQFFAKDADWAFQNYPAMKGRDAIYAFFSEAVKLSKVRIEPTSDFSNGSLGWSQCAYHVQPLEEGVAPWTYRTLYNWEMIDNEWSVKVAMGVIEP